MLIFRAGADGYEFIEMLDNLKDYEEDSYKTVRFN